MLTVLMVAFSSLIAAGCASSKAPRLRGAEAYYQEGREALERDKCVEAAEKFERLVNNYPGSRLVPDAQYYLGEAYYCSGDYVSAVFEYQRLLDTYPSSEWVDDAQYKIAESYYEQVRRAELDQQETRQALAHYRYFVEDNPGSPLLETAYERIADCRDRLARKQFLAGRLYHKQGYLEAADITYGQLVRNYPDTVWYYHGLLRRGEVAQAQGDMDTAVDYWAEVARDSDDEKLRQEASERLQSVAPAQGG